MHTLHARSPPVCSGQKCSPAAAAAPEEGGGVLKSSTPDPEMWQAAVALWNAIDVVVGLGCRIRRRPSVVHVDEDDDDDATSKVLEN